MPVFTYRAADRRGQTIDGVMEAVDARAVAEQLRKDSYYPITVAAQSERTGVFSLGGTRAPASAPSSATFFAACGAAARSARRWPSTTPARSRACTSTWSARA